MVFLISIASLFCDCFLTSRCSSPPLQVSPSTSYTVLRTAVKQPDGSPHANTRPRCRPRARSTRAPQTTATWREASAPDAHCRRPGGCCQSNYTRFGSEVELAAKCCDVGGLERSPGFKGRRGKRAPHTHILPLTPRLINLMARHCDRPEGPCVPLICLFILSLSPPGDIYLPITCFRWT